MKNELSDFFYPSSICIVGASTKEKSIGYELLKTIKTYQYTGRIFPVNPKADEILGYKCFHSLEEITENIDLAIVVVPKQFAEQSIDELIALNVKSIVLITAGFKEVGSEGEEAEKRITEKIKKAGARIVGPNCMGVISTSEKIKLNATFVAEKPLFGKTGFLSQSGALGAAVLNSLRETDIKFSHFISVGNKADINENDLLSFWQEDDSIKTLAFYLESFIDGEGFIKKFIKREVTKPVVVLKAGRTESGKIAASSHTGALSSNDVVVDAIFSQFGIIRAENLNELFNTAKGFENFPIPKGKRIAVITNAGGPAILTVDRIENEGLKLAQLSENTKTLLREIVHPEGSVNNPVDLLPGGNAEIYGKVTGIIAKDENVDAIISIFVEPVMVSPMPVVENVASVKSDKPILQVVMPLPEFWNDYRKNEKLGLPLFKNPEDPAEVLANMFFHSKQQERLDKNKHEFAKLLNISRTDYSSGKRFLDQKEIIPLVEKFNIPITKNYFLKPDEIASAEFTYPIVLKGINDRVIHKSEMDAVKLNIRNETELKNAVFEIEKNFRKSGYNVEEYLVQPFISTKHEILLGGFRDPSFGPMIMFGTGGKYVEVYNDTVIKSAYLTETDIDEMIFKTCMGKILLGVRNEKPADIQGLKKIIQSASKMMLEYQNIIEFDFNPLLVDKNGLFHAVDIRIRID